MRQTISFLLYERIFFMNLSYILLIPLFPFTSIVLQACFVNLNYTLSVFLVEISHICLRLHTLGMYYNNWAQ